MKSDETKLLIAYRALTPEDRAIVDHILVKIQMAPTKNN